MTIAVSVKVHDGLVLAADSASTIIGQMPPHGAHAVVNVYNNANKVFSLYKGLPIGGLTWGAGSIGTASISSLTKEIRRRLSGQDSAHPEWGIDRDNYTIRQVAERVRQFLYDENFVRVYQGVGLQGPATGFLVAGYSSGQALAEDWLVQISPNAPQPTLPRAQEDVGCLWYGETEALERLMLGYGSGLAGLLGQVGIPGNRIAQAMEQITRGLDIPLIVPPMPIQDAIDLAEFLVHLAIQYSRFKPGAPTVGGPIEVAAITKHEGFKWIRRKHYYDPKYNPSLTT